MTTYLLIQNGSVVNAAEFDGVMPNGWAESGTIWVEAAGGGGGGGIGWTYSDGNFIAPPVPEPPPPSTDPASYPLSARQLRLGLVRNGVSLATVQATIDKLPAPERDEAQIYWDFSTEIHWEHPMTQSLMALAGIPDEAAAAMWMLAKDYEK